ncbi:MAG: MTH1187 family thiamine-binding protein [Dehalococcoidia bacterium]
MIVEIQCLPSPAGDSERPYRHIEAAIAVIQGSGLRYEVGALGTTLEGEPDAVWAAVRAAHEAVLHSGAAGLVTVLKVEQTRPEVSAPTIASLTGKFRP